jgi:Outer membrane protein beta-barrel family/Carboxypeptidase regulatory-like domain
MSKYVLLLLLSGLFFATPSFSQGNVHGTVKGVLVDSAHGKQPLQNATISIRPLGGDSSEAEYAVSDKKGAFQFRGLTAGQYFVLITYEGYQHMGRNITISDSSVNVDLSTLYMQPADEMLAAAIVQRPPMGIHKDTVEYNATLFATKPNAVAEDLLKKMPGVQVDNSGNITAQGETVQRVLVNGKRFFSDDPKQATRNLPPDVIDKIQVFDDLSDQSKFTGFDDGNRVKTINIITKKNMSQGIFGKYVAGAGTDQDYDESLNTHVFRGNQQISVLGQANDLNKQNFTAQDIFGGSGGQGRRAGGGGSTGGGGGIGGGSGGGGGTNSGGASSAGTSFQSNGVTTIWAGGLNYRNTVDSGKVDIYGSYFYNYQHIVTKTTDSTISQLTSEITHLPDSSQTTAGNQYSVSRISNHRVYFNLEDRFDSNNSLIFRPNIIFQHSDPSGSSYTSTINPAAGLVNTLNGRTSSSNTGFSVPNADLQFRHRFAKPSRTISLDITGSGNVNNGDGYTYSVNNYYLLDSTQNLNQFYKDSLHQITIQPTLSYTEPLSKHMILQLNYSHIYTRSTTINDTYDYVDSLKGYDSFDSLFSNSYKFTQNSDQVGLYWRIQETKFNLSVGSGVQWTTFASDNTTKDITVARSYTNLTPTVNFSYNFSSTKHFRLNYMGRTGTPSPSQLQPLTTTTDDVNFQVGNPNLKPQFTQSLRMLYASFDPSTQKVLFATVNGSMITNDIQSEVYSTGKATGGQTSTYTNLNGTYNLSGYLNYGFPLRVPKSNMNFITNVSYSQSQTLQASDAGAADSNIFTHIYTKNTSVGETISWTTNIRKNFDMNVSAASTYTIPAHKEITPTTSVKSGSSAINSNLNSFSEVVSTEFTAYTNNGWLMAASFDYTYTYTGSNTYNVSAPILTPSIAKQLFKKKNGEIRLSVFDVLNKNASVSKSVSTSNVAYSRTNVLSRYAMLTFTYNLNNFPGQRRGPGNFPGGGRFRPGGGPPGGGGNFRGGPLP